MSIARGLICLSDQVAVSSGRGRVQSSCSSHLRAFAGERLKPLQRDNPSCFPEMFVVGAAQAAVGTRHRIVRHPNCPSEALTVLAHDPEPDLRSAATSNPKCTQAEHQMLLGDPDVVERVRSMHAVRS